MNKIQDYSRYPYNRIFVIERNDFSELGLLVIMVTVTGGVVSSLAVLFVNAW
jgi:hypothetical protein